MEGTSFHCNIQVAAAEEDDSMETGLSKASTTNIFHKIPQPNQDSKRKHGLRSRPRVPHYQPSPHSTYDTAYQSTETVLSKNMRSEPQHAEVPVRASTQDSGYCTSELERSLAELQNDTNGCDDDDYPLANFNILDTDGIVDSPSQSILSLSADKYKYCGNDARGTLQPRVVDIICTKFEAPNHQTTKHRDSVALSDDACRMDPGIGAQFEHTENAESFTHLEATAKIDTAKPSLDPRSDTGDDLLTPTAMDSATSSSAHKWHLVVTEHEGQRDGGNRSGDSPQSVSSQKHEPDYVLINASGNLRIDHNDAATRSDDFKSVLLQATERLGRIDLSDTASTYTTTTITGSSGSKRGNRTYGKSCSVARHKESGHASQRDDSEGESDEDEEDDEGDSENPNQPEEFTHVRKKVKTSGKHSLACHFNKLDPSTFCARPENKFHYKKCDDKFPSINSLTQHYNEVHYYGKDYCIRCFVRYRNGEHWMKHSRQDERCKVMPIERIKSELWLTPGSGSRERLRKLGKKKTNTSTEDHWKLMWEALFPSQLPCPEPYWEEPLIDDRALSLHRPIQPSSSSVMAHTGSSEFPQLHHPLPDNRTNPLMCTPSQHCQHCCTVHTSRSDDRYTGSQNYNVQSRHVPVSRSSAMPQYQPTFPDQPSLVGQNESLYNAIQPRFNVSPTVNADQNPVVTFNEMQPHVPKEVNQSSAYLTHGDWYPNPTYLPPKSRISANNGFGMKDSKRAQPASCHTSQSKVVLRKPIPSADSSTPDLQTYTVHPQQIFHSMKTFPITSSSNNLSDRYQDGRALQQGDLSGIYFNLNNQYRNTHTSSTTTNMARDSTPPSFNMTNSQYIAQPYGAHSGMMTAAEPDTDHLGFIFGEGDTPPGRSWSSADQCYQ